MWAFPGTGRNDCRRSCATATPASPTDCPLRRVVYKLGLHDPRVRADPALASLGDSPADLALLAEMAASLLPEAAPEPVATERCFYDNTPDQDFVLDRVVDSSSGRARPATGSSSPRSWARRSPTWPKESRRRSRSTASRSGGRRSARVDPSPGLSATALRRGEAALLTAASAGATLKAMTEGRLPPRELLAALEARRELGDEYDRALLEGFVDQASREIDARVDARVDARFEEMLRHAPGRRRSGNGLSIVSLVFAVPLTAIAGALGHVEGIAVVWAGIAFVNAANAWRTRVPWYAKRWK